VRVAVDRWSPPPPPGQVSNRDRPVQSHPLYWQSCQCGRLTSICLEDRIPEYELYLRRESSTHPRWFVRLRENENLEIWYMLKQIWMRDTFQWLWNGMWTYARWDLAGAVVREEDFLQELLTQLVNPDQVLLRIISVFESLANWCVFLFCYIASLIYK
jgi:hypothetical protein